MREDIRRRVANMFSNYDFIVTPTMACLPFPLGQRPTEIDGVKVDSLWGPFPFAAPFNVSGSPAASVPVGLSDGLPVGLQVVAPFNAEGVLLDFCEELEAALPSTLDIMKSRWGHVGLNN
jgi:Asp-tRNA(Asn)/Glu-tRNA(Gln) amidotransferase A subunit family amidase